MRGQESWRRRIRAIRCFAMNETADVITKVRRALGRVEPLKVPPTPPAIDEPITRLVNSDIGLAELFAKRAAEQNMTVVPVRPEDLLERLERFLRENGCKKIALSDSPVLQRLGVAPFLNMSGFTARTWAELTLDDAYDFDAGVTDVYRAVAETGSLVLRFGPGHGRILSLAPFVHVAIVEPKNFMPDLLDLLELMSREPCPAGACLVSGPSKTADIEMNVVTGVHGPNVVGAFILS